jgi:hypothetical protein
MERLIQILGQSAPKSSPRSHTDSILDVLYMDVNITG